MNPVSKAAACLVSYRKNLVLLSMVLGSGSPVVFLLLYADPRIYNGKVYWIRQYTENVSVNPNVFLTDDSIREMEKPINKLKPCTPHPLLDSNKTHIWIDKENLPHYKLNSSEHIICCYRSFYRPTSIPDITSSQIDKRIKYNNCRNFSDSIKIDVKDEFVRVNCSQTEKLFDSFFLLAREKKIITPKKNLDYNILILGIDAVSRLNLHRSMPKTVAFLSNLGAVELLRYNKVGDNTFPNLVPLLLGKNVTELKETCWPHDRLTFDNCPFIWEWFHQTGFATALGEDSASLGTFNYLKKRGFAGTPTTYYLYPFIREAETIAGSNKDSNVKICMNEKFFFKIILDYVADLTMSVTKNKLFGFFWEVTMSHDNLNYPMVMDDSYREFFRQMHASGYLRKTIIVLMSDHGMRFGTFRKTRQGFFEDRLPFIVALMPPSFRKNFSEVYNNLKINVRSLTTPYDVHATFSDLINLDNIKNAKIMSRTKESYSSKRGISLFLPISRNRTCKSAAIDDHWCVKYKNAIVEANKTEAKEAIRHVMTHLNGLLQDYPQCAKLKLSKVLVVTRLLSDSPKEKNESIELTVGVQTNPGGGKFEATLEREGGVNSSWSLAGSTSRLNAYRNQSYCAPTDDLKLYCYCIDTTSRSTKN